MILASVLLVPVQDHNGGDIQESLLARLVSPAEIYTQPPKVSSLRGRRQLPPVLPPSPVAMPSAAIPPPPQAAYTPAPIPQPVVPSPQPYRESREKTVTVKEEPLNVSKEMKSKENRD